MTASTEGKSSLIDVKVFPKSGRTSIELSEDQIKVRLKSPPERGKANLELMTLFKELDPDVRIVSGFNSQRKKLLLPNTPLDVVYEMLGILSADN